MRRPAAPPEPRPSWFASGRERRLWAWAALVVAAIFATLGTAQALADAAVDQGLVSDLFWVGLWLVAAAVATHGLRIRPGGREWAVGLGVAGALLIAGLRTVVPGDRSHLIEYAIVAVLVHAALEERAAAGRPVPRPALLAIGLTVGLGLLDETLQAVVPGRVFSLFDLAFDTIAAVLAVGGSLVVGAGRRALSARSRGRTP